MKTREELQDVIQLISKADSPVGMDAVYVHALILDKLNQIQQRLDGLSQADTAAQQQQQQ